MGLLGNNQVTWDPRFAEARTGPQQTLVRSKRKRKRRSWNLPDASLGFMFFLSVVAVLFLRPAELFPAYATYPIYEGLILGAFGLSLNRVQTQLKRRTLVRQPISVCTYGLLVAIIMSHLSHMSFGVTLDATIMFLKVLVFYTILVSVVDTPERLRWLQLTVAVVASLMVTLCVVDYIGWHDFQFIQHLNARDDIVTAAGERMMTVRMRGTGIFQDPNDLSMLIVATGVLCAYFLSERESGPLRFAWLLPILILGVALLFTRSRGGLLAAGAAGMALVGFRYGRKYVIAGGLMGVVLLKVIAGRQGNINLEEGDTAHERILLWREGLQMLKSPDILFGIGESTYADEMGLVAHNSFVHAFVELGIFGGTLFLGCFAFAALGLYRGYHCRYQLDHPEIKAFLPFMVAILAGWGGSMLSLSRCYVVPTYLIFGMASCYLTIFQNELRPPRLLIRWDRQHVKHLAMAGVCTLAGVYVFVRIVV